MFPPRFRHTFKEARVFRRAGLAAQGGRVLPPVQKLLIASVMPLVFADRTLTVKELHAVIADFRLHSLPGQRGIESVAVRFNRHKAAFVDRQRHVTEHVVRMFGQSQQFPALLFPQLPDEAFLPVMLPFRVLFALFPQIFIERREIRNRRDGNEQVSPGVAYLILYVSFLVAFARIAEIRLKAVVEFEAREAVRQDALRSLQNLNDRGGEVVETNPERNASDTLKDPLQPFQQAFLILGRENLRVGVVGIRKRHRQGVSFLALPLRVVVKELPEVRLRAAFRRVQRQPFLSRHLHRTLLPAHVPLHAGVAALIALLVPQTLVDPHRRVPLFPGNLPVRFQPRVNRRDVRSQRRVILRLSARLRLLSLVPVVALGVLAHRLEAQSRPAADFPQTGPFIFVQVFDSICLSHSNHLSFTS